MFGDLLDIALDTTSAVIEKSPEIASLAIDYTIRNPEKVVETVATSILLDSLFGDK